MAAQLLVCSALAFAGWSGRPRALGVHAPHVARLVRAPVVASVGADQAQEEGTWIDGLRSGMRRGLRNISDGEPGQRGEAYVGMQVAALVIIIFGELPGVPLLRLLHLLLGPLCASTGAALAAISAFRLGSSLSPWPVPVKENVLRTTGPYALCRHPMYVGLLTLAVGCATMAQSVPRVVLSACLALLLRDKAVVEERLLRQRHGKAWDAYAASTPRFVPAAVSRLPLERVKQLWTSEP